jgi:hypothetical protein
MKIESTILNFEYAYDNQVKCAEIQKNKKLVLGIKDFAGKIHKS